MLANVVVRLGSECSVVQSVPLLTASTGLPDEFYGNIGQSALGSFSSFTLDFNAMHFSIAGVEGILVRYFLCHIERVMTKLCDDHLGSARRM